ncbi:FG-GAP repeat protein [Vibrio lentus]|nr:FG-GAP repeat protein [Vibrio lentus]
MHCFSHDFDGDGYDDLATGSPYEDIGSKDTLRQSMRELWHQQWGCCVRSVLVGSTKITRLRAHGSRESI